MEKHIRLYILWFPEIANQMEEPKEMSNNKNAEQLDVYNVAYSPKQQVKKDIAEKLYQVLSFSESILIQEIDKCKKGVEETTYKNVEKDLRETVNHELPMKSIPRPDDGFLCLTTKRDWYGRLLVWP
ncbi:hypothetical protein Tco_0470792 [Tanacetum coccineum]